MKNSFTTETTEKLLRYANYGLMLAGLVTCVFITIYSVYYSNYIILSEATTSKRDIMERFADEISEDLRTASEPIYRLAYNETFRAALSSSETNPEGGEDLINLLIPVITRGAYTNARIFLSDRCSYLDRSDYFAPMADAQWYFWYEKTVALNGEPLWTEPYTSGAGGYPNLPIVSVTRLIKSWDEYDDTIGLLEIDIDINALLRMSILKTRRVLEGDVYIINRSGTIISSLSNLDLKQNVREKSGFEDYSFTGDVAHQTKDRLYITVPLSYPEDWHAVVSVSKDTILHRGNYIMPRLTVLIFSIIVIIVAFQLCGMLLSKYRFHRLISEIEKTLDLSYTEESGIYKQIESNLKKSLTSSAQSQILANIVNKINLQKLELQLSAMRAKLNPHTLYNQLDAINWLAIRENHREISVALRNLAAFYRSYLANSDDIVTIAQECEQIQYYVPLVMLRTNGDIVFHIDQEPSISDCIICSSTLLPLVENSVEHGMLGQNGQRGEISIKLLDLGDKLYVEVSDNGCGMPDYVVHALNTDGQLRRKHKGYGFYNVNQRIKMFFGEEYRFTVESSPAGTKVFTTLPKLFGGRERQEPME